MRETVMVGLRRYAFCDMGCWHRVAEGESLTAHNKVSEDVNACLDALAASQAELADWKANAQRENALLVQAQQRIADLEQEREDVRRVEAYREHYSLWEDGDGVLHIISGMNKTIARGNTVVELGRMLKEGENAN